MQFRISALPLIPDVDRVEAAITELDPAALVDYDAVLASLRLSTSLEPADIALALAGAGVPVAASQVQRQPSECCGGCGG